MKKRTGFVSNSSSSSFIIAAKPDKTLMANLAAEIDVANYVSDKISSLKELDEYIIEQHGWDGYGVKEILKEDSYAKREYDTIHELILKGLVVYLGSADSEGDTMEQMLCDVGVGALKFSDDIIIVEGEGGF